MNRLMAEIGESAGGVSEADRQRRAGDLESRLLELERVEEAVVEALLASGVDCQRRHDASEVKRGAAAA